MKRANFETTLSKFCLFGMVLLLCASGQSARASLIITIYHQDAMYMAGDSAATSRDTGERTGTVQKVYPFAENCCVAMAGSALIHLDNLARSTTIIFTRQRQL